MFYKEVYGSQKCTRCVMSHAPFPSCSLVLVHLLITCSVSRRVLVCLRVGWGGGVVCLGGLFLCVFGLFFIT